MLLPPRFCEGCMAITEVKLQHCFALTQRRLAMETLPRLMLQFVLPVICQEDSLPQWIQLTRPRLNLKNHTHNFWSTCSKTLDLRHPKTKSEEKCTHEHSCVSILHAQCHINARSSVFHDHYPMRPIIFEACFHSRGSPRAQFEGPDPHRTLGARWFGDQPVRVRRFGLLEVFNPFNSKNWMVNTSTLRKILLPRLSMLQKSPNPRITSRSQLPSTPVVRRDCLARALPRRLGNLRDVAEDVASFAPQISRITVLGWGNLPNPSDPKGQSTWWCMVLKETKKWKMVR